MMRSFARVDPVELQKIQSRGLGASARRYLAVRYHA